MPVRRSRGRHTKRSSPRSRPSPLGSEGSAFARLEAEQAAAGDAAPADAPGDAGTFRPEPQKLVSADEAAEPAKDEEDPGEVDRVMLAKEFSGLLQLGEDGDED